MISQNEKIELFLNAISENLELRRREIDAEILSIKTAEQEKAAQEAAERSEAFIKTESAKAYAQANRTRSALETGLRNDIAATRSEITDKVFEAAAEKLRQFMKTGAYKDFLKKSAGRIAAYYGNKKVTVFLKTADMEYKDIILSAFSAGCTVLADDSILIGGCKAKNEQTGVCIDDTLDARLNAQKQSFYESSGLSVQAV